MRPKRLMLVAGVVLVAMALSGCQTVKETAYGLFDPGTSPRMDSYLSPGWGGDSPTVCIPRASVVSNRYDHCRVERGFEDGSGGWPDDTRQWVIDFSGDLWHENPLAFFSYAPNPYAGQHPYWACPGDTTYPLPHGCTIVVKDWGAFEGCFYHRGNNSYVCDYRARFHKIMAPEPFNFLKATIDWAAYVVSAAGCATKLYTHTVDNPMLVNCNDGPYSGHLQSAPAAPTTPTDPLGDEPLVTSVPDEEIPGQLLVNPQQFGDFFK